MDTLLLRLLPCGDRVEWLISAAGQPAEPESGTLEEFAARVQGRGVHVAVPGADIVLCRVQWSGGGRQRLRQALPYQLEEQLIGDVETQHFALGQWEGDQLAVAVVSRARMDDWLSTLADAGLTPQTLVPDFLTLGWENGQWRVHFDGEGGCLVRSASQGGFTADPENAEFLLRVALEQTSERPQQVCLSGQTPGWCEGFFAEMGIETQLLAGAMLQQWSAASAERSDLSLLQGDYSRKERLGRLLRPWLPATAVLGVWLVLSLVNAGVDYWHLSDERDQLRQQINQVYLDTFPEAKRVVNARVQMEQQLAALRETKDVTTGAALALLDTLSEAVAAESGARLRRVDYQNGSLNFTLNLPGQQALEPFKQRLSGRSLDIQSVTPQGSEIELQAQLKQGAK